MSGSLTLVATPLGNLGDLSPRARDALCTASVVLCEDTRRTGPLLRHAGAQAQMWTLHEHNERERIPAVLDALRAGGHVALVSDAGTPLLNDPGFPLVRAVLDAGFAVAAIPGPSAAVLALVLSGLPPLPYAVFGFLPAKPGARATAAAAIAAWPHSAVVYLSPHRGEAELQALSNACPGRAAALARELTKLHEEVWRGSLEHLAARVAAAPPKGEWTLVIGPALPTSDAPAPADLVDDARALAERLGLSLKEAAFRVAQRHGLKRRAVYRELLRAGHDDEEDDADERDQADDE